MTEAKNIHEAILQVMGEVGYVQKEQAGGLSYTFASERALIAALRPAMIEAGIIAWVLELVDVRRERYQTKSGTPMTSTLDHGVVRFLHVPSDTYIDAHATGEGADAGDKSANKAATGLLKYALRQTFLIETGDDPDREDPHAGEGDGPEPSEPVAAKFSWPSEFFEALIPEVLPEDVDRRDVVNLLNLLADVGGFTPREIEPEDAADLVLNFRRIRAEGDLESREAAVRACDAFRSETPF